MQEFVAQFEAENPDIKVDTEVIPSAQYAAKLRLMKNANTPFDALYVFDHILSQWAAWLEPLDGYDGADAEADDAPAGPAVDDVRREALRLAVLHELFRAHLQRDDAEGSRPLRPAEDV